MFFRFDEFVDEVMDCIKDYMPDEYQDYSYELQTINKGTKSYTGLVIRDKDAAGATPVINLDNVYKDYEKDYDKDPQGKLYAFYDAIDRIVEIRVQNDVSDNKGLVNVVTNFDEKRVFLRLINTERNKDFIQGKPHFEVEDLTAVFTYRIDSPAPGTIAETVITEDLCDMWGIPSGMLRAYANKNIKDASYLFEDVAKSAGFPVSLGIYVLTNIENVHGAYEMLNPIALEAVREKIGDFYILPSSINELIVVPKEAGDRPEGLREIVRTINAEEVKPEEQLSDSIYEYDSIQKEVRIVR